jgi:hypothetical protein
MKTYTVKIDEDGSKFWYFKRKLHREDGPAIEFANGEKHWFLNDKLHREDGPAIEGTNGDKHWCLNGVLHRKDGPAVEYANGTVEWYINGKELAEEEFNSRTGKNITPSVKVVEIDGVKYELKKID